MWPDFYILVGKMPVAVDMMTWAKWFENIDHRRVALNEYDGLYVSTVFLGRDHNFSEEGPPLLFETMVFGGRLDGYQTRSSTWMQAEASHAYLLAMSRADMEVTREEVVRALREISLMSQTTKKPGC